MFQFVFRIAGLFVLALALVLAVLDITRSITASAIMLTPFAQTWADFSPQSLLASKAMVESVLPDFFWDPILTFLLALPSWLVFWTLAMFLLWLGKKRETQFGRFASR